MVYDQIALVAKRILSDVAQDSSLVAIMEAGCAHCSVEHIPPSIRNVTPISDGESVVLRR